MECQYCGNHHKTICPTIKAVEFHPDGSTKRVEFKSASDYAAVQYVGHSVATPAPFQHGGPQCS